MLSGTKFRYTIIARSSTTQFCLQIQLYLHSPYMVADQHNLSLSSQRQLALSTRSSPQTITICSRNTKVLLVWSKMSTFPVDKALHLRLQSKPHREFHLRVVSKWRMLSTNSVLLHRLLNSKNYSNRRRWQR